MESLPSRHSKVPRCRSRFKLKPLTWLALELVLALLLTVIALDAQAAPDNVGRVDLGGASAENNARGVFSREALFKRAFSSAAYMMSMAELDQGFVSSLSADEKKMFNGVLRIAQEARNREWLVANRIQNFPSGTKDRYFFVFSGWRSRDEERAMGIESEVRFGLEFSSDQSLFRVRADEPIRTATSSESLSEPVRVNLAIINQPDAAITFSDALQIMLHEFGHKLGPAKIQSAVDSMAEKMKAFIEAQTVNFKISGGNVKVIKFSKRRFEEWMEVTFQGRYVGVNIPNKIEPFRVVTNEGIYAFFEGPGGAFDLSPQLHADLARQSVFEPYKGMPYRWFAFHHFSVNSVSVREIAPGQVRLEVGAGDHQAVLPFLTDGDPDPSYYRPFKRIFAKGEAGQSSFPRLEWTWNLQTPLPSRLSVWVKPLVYENTSVTAQRVTAGFEGDDLVLTYWLPVAVEVRGSGSVEVRAFLMATLGSLPLEIEGKRLEKDSNLVVFRVRGAASAMSGTLKPVNIEVEPKERNLAKPYYVRTRLFLDKSDSFQLSGAAKPTPLKLKAADPRDGRFKDTDTLKLIFESSTKLGQLKLQLGIKQTEAVTSRISAHGEPEKVVGSGTRALPDASVSLVVPFENLTQELNGTELIVSVDLKRGILTSNRFLNDISPSDLSSFDAFKLIEDRKTDVLPERSLLGVEATNLAGQTLRTEFTGAKAQPVKYTWSFKPVSGRVTCEGLFNSK